MTDIPEATLKSLIDEATRVSKNAYCPYSHFPVGAAVLTESGEIFSGCNVENASYGLTVCAERNAMFQAVAAGHNKLRALVVVTPTSVPTPPCGACRQVANEFGADASVFVVARDGKMIRARVDELLPKAFGPHNL
jgi:cytidine deaminase